MARPSRKVLLLAAILIAANGLIAVSKLHAEPQRPFQRCRYIDHNGHQLEGCEDWLFTTCGAGACAPA